MRSNKEGQAGEEARVDVKSEVAQRLIDAMREGNTPWQRPWSAAAMLPTNMASGNAYRGVNRLLLSIAAMEHATRGDDRTGGGVDNRFMTYQQAAAKGWQVRKGSRGTPIVKLVEIGSNHGGATGGESASRDAQAGTSGEAEAERGKRFLLRRYAVFNATQIEGVPPLPEEAEPDWDPVEKAEGIMEALKKRTGLTILYGGDRACYVPSTDQVLLPERGAFKSLPGVQAAYGFYSVALHECSHSSMAKHRLNRAEALGNRFGDEAYALEELTVEISAACLAAETGVPIIHARPQDHIDHHARYLKSWIAAIRADPMAIFTAAKSAESICGYLLGLERQHARMDQHAEWIADYESAESACQSERHR